MLQNSRSAKYAGLIEKYTNTGTSRYVYADHSLIWSPSLFGIFDLNPASFSAVAEMQIPCFSEHTQKLIERRISVGESSLEPFDIRLPYKSGAGRDKWMRFCCEFISDDGILLERISIFQDITQTVNLAEHNNYYQERVELALTSSNAGTWDYQVVSNELFWDESMFTLFEVQRPNNTMKFSSWMDHVHSDSQDLFVDEFNLALKHQEPDSLLNFVFKTITPLGNIKYIKINAKFYNDIHDKTTRVVGTCIDVTDHEVATIKIIEQATIAQKNAIIAQDANTARARFIANLSHEIRTPMNSILGSLQILSSYDFESDLKQLIEMAADSSNDLLTVINDVLDLSKIDAQRIEMESIDLDLKSLLENAVDKFKPLAKTGVQLRFEFDDDLKSDRMGDPVRFNQILNNLISNAIKFTESGSITIKARGNDTAVEILVCDTGIGIHGSQHIEIFEPFTQADNTTIREFGGTGLGLAISDKLAQLMGGKLRVNSKLGFGSEFIFSVPLPVTSKNVSKTSLSPLSSNIPNLRGHYILYAEDNEASINIAKQLIAPTKAKLLIAKDGRQALELYRRNRDISLVILDIQMPFMNGMEVCERIRLENKRIPIIALTANVMVEDKRNYFNIGFSQIIEKPIKFDKFYETLNNV